MPRVTLTPKTVPVNAFPTLPVAADSLDLPFVAADATNKEQFVLTGKEIIIAHNTGAGARTITVTSVPLRGRTGDVTAYSIGAGEFAAISPSKTGFRQTSGGWCFIEAEHAEVMWAIIKTA